MAGPFDDFPTDQNSGNSAPSISPFSGFPTLGGSVPSAADVEEMRARNRSRAQSAERFSNLPLRERIPAHIQNVTSGVPIAGRFVQPNPNVDELRSGYPITSRIEQTAGHALPYVAAGGGLPALMSTLPRTMAVSGALEGTDAAIGGENVPLAIGRAAASSIPGYLLGKAITPRTPEGAFNTRMNRAMANASYWRRLERQGNQIPADTARAINIARDLPVKTRMGTEGVQPLISLLNKNLTPIQAPFNVPRVPPSVNIGAGILGGYLGNLVSPAHAVGGAVVGTFAPEIARQGANTAIRATNRALQTRIGHALGNAAYGYSINQLLSPEARALLNTLANPTIQETMPQIPALGQQE